MQMRIPSWPLDSGFAAIAARERAYGARPGMTGQNVKQQTRGIARIV